MVRVVLLDSERKDISESETWETWFLSVETIVSYMDQ